jgi:regulator of protease activity HflC (stomatin/prohibitin superfamily)
MAMHPSDTLSRNSERPARTASGYLMLGLCVALVLAAVLFLLLGITQENDANYLMAILITVIAIGLGAGFYMLQPNQAAAITMFGSYCGTDRAEGLRWVWPWMRAHQVSVRANNLISEQIKVNDLRGNPIEIAAQVVWRVADTAQALFDVDDYKTFVSAQIEAAVRSIGSRYPYDDIEHKEVTLRGNHDVVNAELRIALSERLAVAGISVDECALTHLAYAQEIAGSMLRRGSSRCCGAGHDC